MKRYSYICLAIGIALAVGCVPERVVWSPDGSRAIVLGDDGMHLCDVSGRLSGPTAPNASSAEWMPDGKRVVASMMINLNTWDDVSKAFPQDASEAVKNIDAVRAELLTFKDQWANFIDNTAKKLGLPRGQLLIALFKLGQDEGKSLRLKLSQQMGDNLLNPQLNEFVVQVFVAGESQLTPGEVLYRKMQAQGDNGKIVALRLSPTGTMVALTLDQSGFSNGHPNELMVFSTDASGKSCDLGMAAAYPDWSVDGKYVVYVRPANWHPDDKDLLPGALTRRRVVDDKGALFETEHLPDVQDLAGLAFDGWARVRVARDGRIFFSATELTLPVTVPDVPTQGTIFYFDPERSATLTRAVPRGAADTVGNSPNYFELSPDARYVSIPFGDGRVSVLDIVEGDAQLVQPVAEGNGKDLKLQSVPVWRTATELTFIRPTADLQRHEIVRYSVTDKSATTFSAGWPSGTFDILTKPLEPATQPSAPGAK